MTVGELKAALENVPDEAQVCYRGLFGAVIELQHVDVRDLQPRVVFESGPRA